MKNAKLFGVAPLVMVSTCAFAAVPPYHVDDALSGNATVSVSGGCVVAPQSYPGSGFGTVIDSANEIVGTGIVSAEGQLLALVAQDGPRTAATVHKQNMVTGSFSQSGFVNVTGSDLYGFMEQNGCVVGTLLPVMRSTYTYTGSVDGDVLVINAAFVGYLDVAQQCKTIEDTLICRARSFSGSIVFEGSR